MSFGTVQKLHETLLQRAEAFSILDTRTANRVYDQAVALFEEVQKDLTPEVASAFLNLLSEPNPEARVIAASMALLIAPERAVPVLEELAGQLRAGSPSMTAKYMLKKWRSGEVIKF